MKAATFYTVLLFFNVNVVLCQDTVVIKHLTPVIITAVTTKVPEKVWDGFSAYFNGAFVRKWYKVNKRYLVKFMLDETVNRAVFTGGGKLVYYISYGYENNLPADIDNRIKDDYPGCRITQAIKVCADYRVIWVVTVEDSKHIILIRAEKGETEEVERLFKNENSSR